MMIVIGALIITYETTTFDMMPWGGLPGIVNPSAPVPGSRLDFSATAYCKGKTTASGLEVRTGIAAADDSILPVGSVVNVATDNARYNGVYTIMDTGPKVQGRHLDLYIWSCNEALQFGRRRIEVTVLRLGWDPRASSPSLIDRLFRRREIARRAAASRENKPEPEDDPAAAPVADAPHAGDGSAAETPAPGQPTPAETPRVSSSAWRSNRRR